MEMQRENYPAAGYAKFTCLKCLSYRIVPQQEEKPNIYFRKPNIYFRKSNIYFRKSRTIEAVKWNPTENGRQIGGWPRNWGRKPSTWMVNALNLCLILPMKDFWDKDVLPGGWVIRNSKGQFFTLDRLDFEQIYGRVGE